MNDYQDWDDIDDACRMRLVGWMLVGFLVLALVFGWVLFEYAPDVIEFVGLMLMGA